MPMLGSLFCVKSLVICSRPDALPLHRTPSGEQLRFLWMEAECIISVGEGRQKPSGQGVFRDSSRLHSGHQRETLSKLENCNGNASSYSESLVVYNLSVAGV